MAKKKGPKPGPEPTVAFQIRIPAALNAALEEAARQGERPKNQQVIVALKFHLADMYLWPPRAAESNQEPPE